MAEIYKIYKKMIERPPETGFHKLNGYNRPHIDYLMIVDFLAKTADTKLQTPKNRKEYLDEDIDFVQCKTTTAFIRLMCLVSEKGQAFAADRISVGVVIDAKRKEFTSVVCSRCEGRLCDHGIGFLFWLYRRSNEPNSDRPAFWGCNPPTELIVMPIKQLYHLTQQFEHTDTNDNGSNRDNHKVEDNDDVLMEVSEDDSKQFLEKFLDNLKENGQTDLPIYRMHRPVDEPHQEICLYHIMTNADRYQITQYKHLLMHLQSAIGPDVIDAIRTETGGSHMYKSRLWLELQYGRIRCSILNDVTRWKTESDVLEAVVMGTYRIPREDEAVKRKARKRSILAEISKCYQQNIQPSGVLLDLAYPMFCATPDGLSGELVVEIKLPATQEEYARYLIDNEKIPAKYFAQIQMQMFLANRQRALYCVVAPDFAKSGAVEYINVDLKKAFVEPLFAQAEDVWNKLIFPVIQRNAERSEAK